MSDETTAGVGSSRRTLLKGAAWSIPVMAIAAAAPAHAASVDPDAPTELYYFVDDASHTLFVINPTDEEFSGTLAAYHGVYTSPADSRGPLYINGVRGGVVVASVPTNRVVVKFFLGTQTIAAKSTLALPITLITSATNNPSFTNPGNPTSTTVDNLILRKGVASSGTGTGTAVASFGSITSTVYWSQVNGQAITSTLLSPW
ncbi:MAG: hypothetical protein QM606_00745 [Leucobacter sp.]